MSGKRLLFVAQQRRCIDRANLLMYKNAKVFDQILANRPIKKEAVFPRLLLFLCNDAVASVSTSRYLNL